ncbi:hypothetical protein BH10ACT2_BH10ACT2_23280 [soil metagenome]
MAFGPSGDRVRGLRLHNMTLGVRLQHLTAEECLQLLAGTDLARLALTRSALPFVAPVRFRLEQKALLISADGGSPVANAARDRQVVCLEADDIIAGRGGQWVVHVTGPLATFTTGLDELDEASLVCTIDLSTAVIAGWLRTS